MKQGWKKSTLQTQSLQTRHVSVTLPKAADRALLRKVTVLGLQAGKPCRLSRELGATVFCKNWEARRNKPKILYPLCFEGHACKAPPLQVVIGREDGHTYYCAEPVQSSPAAAWMLHASDSMQKACSRLTLLLTPTSSLKFPKDFTATLTEDIKEEEFLVANGARVAIEVCKTDGQSDISPDLAKWWSILPKNVGPTRPCLYAAGQWRAFMPTDQGTTASGKGMFLADPFLKQPFRLRRSCVKLEAAGGKGIEKSVFSHTFKIFQLWIKQDIVGTLCLPAWTRCARGCVL